MARNNAWHRFGEQVQRNLVALISLFIAISSLGYNTWRNEKTEYNRNLRAASFEMLIALSGADESSKDAIDELRDDVLAMLQALD